jgi:hypothetical protein
MAAYSISRRRVHGKTVGNLPGPALSFILVTLLYILLCFIILASLRYFVLPLTIMCRLYGSSG